MMKIHTIAYRSTPVFKGTICSYLEEIESIIAKSHGRNKLVGVTGVMLFNEDWFVQYLEGSDNAIRTTFERILHDRRHEHVEVLFSGTVDRRHFPEWSMAFVGHSEAFRRRFAASPLARACIKLRGKEVVDYIVALADLGHSAG